MINCNIIIVIEKSSDYIALDIIKRCLKSRIDLNRKKHYTDISSGTIFIINGGGGGVDANALHFVCVCVCVCVCFSFLGTSEILLIQWTDKMPYFTNNLSDAPTQ